MNGISQERDLNIGQIKLLFERHEQIDWTKLASVDFADLNDESMFSVEMLQEHLSYVAFCKADKEISLNNLSGQRSLQKMFRLAQLIIQYLFLSQEYMEKQNGSILSDYKEMEVKLLEVSFGSSTLSDELTARPVLASKVTKDI